LESGFRERFPKLLRCKLSVRWEINRTNIQPDNPNWVVRLSFKSVNGKPGFFKRITDTANPIVVTIGGGVNCAVYGYAGFVEGFD
jgi:hypothetical protein